MRPVELLIIGGSGFVGAKLTQAAIRAGHSAAYTYSSRKRRVSALAYHVNVEDGGSLEACITKVHPKTIIYCAVPAPQSGENLHKAVSIDGVQRVTAMLDHSQNTKFIYVSTNSVFSGKNEQNRACDKPDPERCIEAYRTYATTRAEGEKIAISNWRNSIVVRTSNVEGWDAEGKLNPRLSSLVTKLKTKQQIERYNNRLISPTLVDNLVDALLEISDEQFDYRGILHIAGSQQISDYEYACLLARSLNADERLVKPSQLNTSTTTGIINISLDTTFTQSLIKTRLANVSEQLSLIFSSRYKKTNR